MAAEFGALTTLVSVTLGIEIFGHSGSYIDRAWNGKSVGFDAEQAVGVDRP
jgi:hypothetical protein